jgi:hypothetical protein
MVFTTDPQKKLKRLLKYIQQDHSGKTVEQLATALEDNFNVGVFINYGRLISQDHQLEVYRRYKGQWMNLLCRIDVPVGLIQKTVDY